MSDLRKLPMEYIMFDRMLTQHVVEKGENDSSLSHNVVLTCCCFIIILMMIILIMLLVQGDILKEMMQHANPYDGNSVMEFQ